VTTPKQCEKRNERLPCWHDRAGHALAITNTPLAANINFEDAFACRFIGNDGDISKFEAGGFVRPQTGVGHKQ